MKKWIWLAALALLLLPQRGTEVGKLLPVETLLIEKQAGQYRVSTDTGHTARDDSLEKAVDALRAEAPGILFLDTADGASVDMVVPMGQQFLLINAAFAIPLLFVNLLRFTIQGLGYSEFAVFAGVFEMVARGAFGLCLVPVLGYTAACFASPAAWVMADLFLFPAYFHCMKKQGYSFKPTKVSAATE